MLYPFIRAADLGTAAESGGNVIRDNGEAGMDIFDVNIATIDASGNNWNPSEQGADQLGLYAVGSSLSGPTSGFPRNFHINASNRIQF